MQSAEVLAPFAALPPTADLNLSYRHRFGWEVPGADFFSQTESAPKRGIVAQRQPPEDGSQTREDSLFEVELPRSRRVSNGVVYSVGQGNRAGLKLIVSGTGRFTRPRHGDVRGLRSFKLPRSRTDGTYREQDRDWNAAADCLCLAACHPATSRLRRRDTDRLRPTRKSVRSS